jgi:hypothetical protein
VRVCSWKVLCAFRAIRFRNKSTVRNLKVSLLLLLISAPAVSAAEPELGANLGIATNTQTSYVYPGSVPYNQANGKEPYFSLKFLLNFESLQIGGMIGYTTPHISYKGDTGNEFKVFLARPLLPVALLANKKLTLGENHLVYAGLALGIGISLYANTDATQGQYAVSNSPVTPLFGLQGGYVYYLGRFGLNAEFSMLGLPEWSGSADKYGYVVYAFTLGIRFRI